MKRNLCLKVLLIFSIFMLASPALVSAIPIPNIFANGSDGPVTITTDDLLTIGIELDAVDFAGVNADWWLIASSNTFPGLLSYDLNTGTWLPGLTATYQGPLFDLATTYLPDLSDLTTGTYTFYFAVDTIMNGILDQQCIYCDSVVVNVIPQAPIPEPSTLLSVFTGLLGIGSLNWKFKKFFKK